MVANGRNLHCHIVRFPYCIYIYYILYLIILCDIAFPMHPNTSRVAIKSATSYHIHSNGIWIHGDIMITVSIRGWFEIMN